MNKIKISLMWMTRKRSHELIYSLLSFAFNAKDNKNIEYILVLDPDDKETLTALETKQGNVLEGPELATLAIEKGIDIPAGHTFNSKDVASFLKDNPTLNVVDFVNDQNVKLQAAGKGTLDAGNYVVGKNIVVVGEDGSVIDILT